MGVIKRILLADAVPKPQFNERLIIELCENVHVHYRNLRLEFQPEEFLVLVDAFKRIPEKAISQFHYGQDKYQALVATTLPTKTEWDSRLQIEEQANGTFHIHYRNLRLELVSLAELGYKELTKGGKLILPE